jgi:hypothetical protein
MPSEEPILITNLEYNHATGVQYPVIFPEEVEPNRPRCSCRKCCSYLTDCFCVFLALFFLAFFFWLYDYSEYREHQSWQTSGLWWSSMFVELRLISIGILPSFNQRTSDYDAGGSRKVERQSAHDHVNQAWDQLSIKELTYWLFSAHHLR